MAANNVSKYDRRRCTASENSDTDDDISDLKRRRIASETNDRRSVRLLLMCPVSIVHVLLGSEISYTGLDRAAIARSGSFDLNRRQRTQFYRYV